MNESLEIIQNPKLLFQAYINGFFPMPDENDHEVFNWYNPDPRAVIFIDKFHINRSSMKNISKKPWQYLTNSNFELTMRSCGNRKDTWITEEMVAAYTALHREGLADSFEVWDTQGTMVGGVYGVRLGKIFCAESMFRCTDDASKAALNYMFTELKKQSFGLVEIQFLTPFLKSVGAEEIPKKMYADLIRKYFFGH